MVDGRVRGRLSEATRPLGGAAAGRMLRIFGRAVVCVCAAVLLARAILAAPEAAAALANADAVYLPALFADLMLGFDWLSGWHLTPGPYVFPDMAIFGAAAVLAADAPTAILLAGVVQAAILVALLGPVGGLMVPGRGMAAALCSIGMLTAIALFGAWLGPGIVADWYVYPILTAFHFGAFLVSLAGLVLLVGHLEEGGAWRLPALVLLSAATTLSDTFLLPFFAAPAVLLCGWAAIDPARRPRAIVAGLVIVATGLSTLLLHDALNPVGREYRLTLDQPMGWSLLLLGRSLWREDPGERAVVGIVLGLAGVFTVAALRRFGRREGTDFARSAVMLFGLSAMLVTAALVVGRGLFRADDNFRYFIPIALWPPIWLGAALARSGALPILSRRLVPCGIAAAVLLAWVLRPPAGLLGMPPWMECFPPEGRTGVLATYWNAKPLLVFSSGRIQVAQISSDGWPYRWIVNERWEREDRLAPGRVAAFDRILMAGADPAGVRALYGAPDRVESCGDTQIWYYGQSGHLRAALERMAPVFMPN
jgi:hypothetical protein